MNVRGYAVGLPVLAIAGVVALRAQVATPTFRAGTTLVEFTVVAQDSKGNAITDLTKDDLVLTDKGQARDIAFFRFDGGLAPVPDAPAIPPPAGFTTNAGLFKGSAGALDSAQDDVADQSRHDVGACDCTGPVYRSLWNAGDVR